MPPRVSLLTVALVFLVSCAGGQQTPPNREEPATKFEQFLLTNGPVLVREFYPIGTMSGGLGSVKFVVLRAHIAGGTDYRLALRFEVHESGRMERERIGTLDADDVASLAAALPQMTKILEGIRQGHSPYTEVDFRRGSIRLGFYQAGTGGAAEGQNSLFIEAGGLGSAAAYFNIERFTELQEIIAAAAAKLRELSEK